MEALSKPELLELMEDFFSGKPVTIDPEIEKEINENMEQFELERSKREAEAIEASKHIYLNV